MSAYTYNRPPNSTPLKTPHLTPGVKRILCLTKQVTKSPYTNALSLSAEPRTPSAECRVLSPKTQNSKLEIHRRYQPNSGCPEA
ncbi:hypothetical protein BDR05DRAFT_1005527 [Suillus weaverae]|nr:hypothetical protein BDR05DRAFT_1005527 [Suillus weaverae]